MQGGVQIAGQLGSAQISLGAVYATVTSHINKNADAYKLLAAGSATFASLMLLQHAWQAIAEQVRAATQAVKDHADAESKVSGKREDTRATMQDILLNRGDTAPGTLDRAAQYQSKLAGLVGDKGTAEAAALLATSGVPLQDTQAMLEMVAATRTGQVDVSDPHAFQRFEAFRRGRGGEGLTEAAGQLVSERARFLKGAIGQATSFEMVEGLFGDRTIVDLGASDKLQTLFEELGVAGDFHTSKRRLQESIDRKNEFDAGMGDPYTGVVPFLTRSPEEALARVAGSGEVADILILQRRIGSSEAVS